MAGLDGISVPMAVLNRGGSLAHWLTRAGITGDMSSGATFTFTAMWVTALFFIVVCMPNSLELMQRFAPALYFEPPAQPSSPAAAMPRRPGWRPNAVTVAWNARWAFLIAAFFVFGALGLSRPSEFLYWQF